MNTKIESTKKSLHDLNQELKYEDDVYVWGFGVSGKWIAALLGDKVKAFVDTDQKKVGRTFNNKSVISIAESQERLSARSIIIVTVVDIQDVFTILREVPHKTWVPLGLYLEGLEVQDNLGLEESAEFVEYSLRAVQQCHQGILSKDTLFLRSVDLVITEKCSLKCKDCANLMQYFEKPVNVSFDETIEDLDSLVNRVEHIFEVRLIGGEPFMHKDIYEIISKVSTYDKISKIVVYTNATIPLQTEKLKKINKQKIIFSITDYGDLSKNSKRVVSALEEFEIPYRLHPPENWTESGNIEDYNRNPRQNQVLFDKCCGKNLLTISNGKLYRCPFASNAERLQAIPRDKSNSVSLQASGDEILNYVKSPLALPACGWCNGRSWDAKEIIPAVQTAKPIKYLKIL